MKISLRVEVVQWLLIAAMFVLAAVSWSHLPERMPVHWNIEGNVDRYGGKFEGVLVLPLVTLGLYLLLLFLPRFDPGYVNYQSFAGAYNLIRVALVVFMASLYVVTLLSALGYNVDVGAIVGVGVGALLLILGNV